MRALLILVSIILTGCVSTGSGDHRYCSAADVNDPFWYAKVKNDYVVAKFGVEYSREAERDINRVAQLMLAQQLHSRVASSVTLIDGTIDRASQRSMVASNVYLNSAKVEWIKQGNCLIAWSGISKQDADLSLDKSLAINQQERKAWSQVHNTYSVALLERHIRQYPLGIYREAAQQRIHQLYKKSKREEIRDSRLMPGAKLLLNGLGSIFG